MTATFRLEIVVNPIDLRGLEIRQELNIQRE